MAIPDFQTIMRPILEGVDQGAEQIGEVVERVSVAFALNDDERSELLPSGRQTRIANRVHWARLHMIRAGLMEATGRGRVRMTPRGREALQQTDRIDLRYLARFPEYVAFRSATRAAGGDSGNEAETGSAAISEETPEELVRRGAAQADAALQEEILDRVIALTPAQFERLLLELLVAMGYGASLEEAAQALGRSGDGGVDGVVDQDPLGLDRVYVQAKRYARDNPVSSRDLRDFFGALSLQKATKGLFATTSYFTDDAKRTADRLDKRIVLLDGRQLAILMIRNNVGVRLSDRIELKRLDEDYFSTV